ncbi:MAG TPA: hypothetical protein V6D22_23655 [Candidatus Obscuribacterales bacterium]
MIRIVFSALVLIAAIFGLSNTALARNNPSVQPWFFEQIEQHAPAAEPPASNTGDVIEASAERLAWELEQARSTRTPLVIEFYSSDPVQCAQYNVTGPGECKAQLAEFERAASQYAGRVRFIRCDVASFGAILNGPDVRVLPTHVFVSTYDDSTHYDAIKVWGLLRVNQLDEAITDTFNIAP